MFKIEIHPPPFTTNKSPPQHLLRVPLAVHQDKGHTLILVVKNQAMHWLTTIYND